MTEIQIVREIINKLMDSGTIQGRLYLHQLLKQIMGGKRCMSDTVKLKCTNCGKMQDIMKYCPFTGFEYNKGWTMICLDCKSPLEPIESEDDDDDNSDNTQPNCDWCGQRTYVHYLVPTVTGWDSICSDCEDTRRMTCHNS